MRNRVVKLGITILTAFMIAFNFYTVSNCDEINTGAYSTIYKKEGVNSIFDSGAQILSVVSVIGAAVSVIALIVLGMKYMYTSVEEKAEIKKRLMPFIIGAVIMFGASGLLGIVQQFAQVIKP